jgi:hypothetical protein
MPLKPASARAAVPDHDQIVVLLSPLVLKLADPVRKVAPSSLRTDHMGPDRRQG